MIVAGFGFRRNVAAASIEAALDAALAECGLARSALDALATADDKADEPALVAFAGHVRLPVLPVEAADMQRVKSYARTRSPRVEALRGVPSVAETCALAAAGRSPRLICARVANAEATCAIATGEAP